MLWAPKRFAAAPNTSHVGLLNSRLLAWWAPSNFSQAAASISAMNLKSNLLYPYNTKISVRGGVLLHSLGLKQWKKTSHANLEEQGWRSGESTCFPPLWFGFDFFDSASYAVGSRPSSERFFSEYTSIFPFSSKTNISTFPIRFRKWSQIVFCTKYIDTLIK